MSEEAQRHDDSDRFCSDSVGAHLDRQKLVKVEEEENIGGNDGFNIDWSNVDGNEIINVVGQVAGMFGGAGESQSPNPVPQPPKQEKDYTLLIIAIVLILFTGMIILVKRG